MRKYPYKQNILGHLIDDGYGIDAICHAWVGGKVCGHSTKLDLQALADKLGRDHNTMHWDIAPLLRCSKCGAKGQAKGGPISIQMRVPFKHSEKGDHWLKPPAR